jgi:hypothetical protein
MVIPMVDYDIARYTRNYYQVSLLKEYPDIVSLAPRLKWVLHGEPTKEAYVVVGVRKLRDKDGQPKRKRLPPVFQMKARGPDGEPIANLMVDFVLEYEGPIKARAPIDEKALLGFPSASGSSSRVRPCPGGYEVCHETDPGGTLGGVAKVDGKWGYILSCAHVLAGPGSFAVGDGIHQPVKSGSTNHIAKLTRWVSLDYSRFAQNEVDAALAEVDKPWDQNVSTAVEYIGSPTAVADPVQGEQVRLHGQSSGLVTGQVIDTDVTAVPEYMRHGVLVEVGFIHVFRVAKTDELGDPQSVTEGGDSGATVWDSASQTVLGVLFAGSDPSAEFSYSYACTINRTLNLLGSTTTGTDGDGHPVSFPPATVKLF